MSKRLQNSSFHVFLDTLTTNFDFQSNLPCMISRWTFHRALIRCDFNRLRETLRHGLTQVLTGPQRLFDFAHGGHTSEASSRCCWSLIELTHRRVQRRVGWPVFSFTDVLNFARCHLSNITWCRSTPLAAASAGGGGPLPFVRHIGLVSTHRLTALFFFLDFSAVFLSFLRLTQLLLSVFLPGNKAPGFCVSSLLTTRLLLRIYFFMYYRCHLLMFLVFTTALALYWLYNLVTFYASIQLFFSATLSTIIFHFLHVFDINTRSFITQIYQLFYPFYFQLWIWDSS